MDARLDDITREARTLLLRYDFGVLGTISGEVEGYPFGSVTPYCMQYDGYPTVLISTISQHFKNATRDDRVSLTVLDHASGNVQAEGRICVLARAGQTADATVHERYLRYFPSAQGYFQAHGFEFFQLVPVRAYYIGGFGRIHWLEPPTLFVANPFDAEQECFIVDHMNRDHARALAGYWARFGDGDPEGEVAMCGIDAEGCDLLCGERRLRVPFDRTVETTDEARAVLVELARG